MRSAVSGPIYRSSFPSNSVDGIMTVIFQLLLELMANYNPIGSISLISIQRNARITITFSHRRTVNGASFLVGCLNWIEFSQFRNGTAINWCPSFNLCIWEVEKCGLFIGRRLLMSVRALFNCISKDMRIQRQIPYCVSTLIKSERHTSWCKQTLNKPQNNAAIASGYLITNYKQCTILCSPCCLRSNHFYF